MTHMMSVLDACIMIATKSTDSHAAHDRIGEIADILATGLLRLMARKSSPISPANRDNPLDFEAGSQRHVQRQSEDEGS